MRACRVVVVSHTAQLGGAETALLRLLDAVDRQRFDVRVVLFDDGELRGRLTHLGFPVEVISLGRLATVTRRQTSSASTVLQGAVGTLRFIPTLARALRTQRPELLVANSLKAATVLSLAAPLVGAPWVWHLHDRLAVDYLPRSAASLLRAVGSTGPRSVITNSHATLQTLGRRGRSNAVVAYPGLEAAAFDRTNIDSATDAIGMVGRISETKGQLLFIQAASELLATRPAARFRIVGAALFQDRDYEKGLRDASADFGCSCTPPPFLSPSGRWWWKPWPRAFP